MATSCSPLSGMAGGRARPRRGSERAYSKWRRLGTIVGASFLHQSYHRISLSLRKEIFMIRFEGDRQLPFAPADAWLKLRDARFLIQCIQGGQPSGAEPTQDQAQCKVRPNVPFVQGVMEVTLRIIEADE